MDYQSALTAASSYDWSMPQNDTISQYCSRSRLFKNSRIWKYLDTPQIEIDKLLPAFDELVDSIRVEKFKTLRAARIVAHWICARRNGSESFLTSIANSSMRNSSPRSSFTSDGTHTRVSAGGSVAPTTSANPWSTRNASNLSPKGSNTIGKKNSSHASEIALRGGMISSSSRSPHQKFDKPIRQPFNPPLMKHSKKPADKDLVVPSNEVLDPKVIRKQLIATVKAATDRRLAVKKSQLTPEAYEELLKSLDDTQASRWTRIQEQYFAPQSHPDADCVANPRHMVKSDMTIEAHEELVRSMDDTQVSRWSRVQEQFFASTSQDAGRLAASKYTYDPEDSSCVGSQAMLASKGSMPAFGNVQNDPYLMAPEVYQWNANDYRIVNEGRSGSTSPYRIPHLRGGDRDASEAERRELGDRVRNMSVLEKRAFYSSFNSRH